MERRKLMVQKPQDLRNNMVVSFLSFLMASILWTMDCRCLQSGMANRHRQEKKKLQEKPITPRQRSRKRVAFQKRTSF